MCLKFSSLWTSGVQDEECDGGRTNKHCVRGEVSGHSTQTVLKPSDVKLCLNCAHAHKSASIQACTVRISPYCINVHRFLEDEPPRLEEAEGKCQSLSATLETLKQVAAVQLHRTPLVPYFRPVANPDRGALMENIKAVTPNHEHRVESIEMAKCVQHKKKELVQGREGIRRFESQLRVQKDHLNRMDSTISQHEDRQARRMIELYLKEKAQRQEELAREIKLERKVAERKRREERERMKERLKQREGERKRTRIEQLRSRTENEQSTQSLTGEESSGEWYSGGGGEDDSMRLSSSYSSTASLLERVRNISKWSSAENSLQENSGEHLGTEKQKQAPSTKSDKTSKFNNKHRETKDEPPRRVAGKPLVEGGSGVDSKPTDGGNPPHRGIRRSKMVQGRVPKPTKRTPQQQQQQHQQEPHDHSQLNTASQQKGPARDREKKSKQEPARHKSDSKPHTGLNNTQVRAKSATIHSPTTGLHDIFKVNQTAIPQGLPQKHTNKKSSASGIPKGNVVQPTTKQPPVEANRRVKKRVPLNDPTANPAAARRVSSSDALFEDPTNQPLSPSSVVLANAPPRMRNSIGHIGELDSVYDLLEKKVQPPPKSDTQPQAKRGSRLQMGFQTPTFDPATRQEDDQQPSVPPPPLPGEPVSRSQPDNFEFSSNPSYETGERAKRSVRESTTESSSSNRTNSDKQFEVGRNNANQNGVVNHKLHSHVHQQRSYVPQPSHNNATVVHQSHLQTSHVPRVAAITHHTAHKVQRGGGLNSAWQQSESDSSETERIRSVLSDHSSTTARHSTASTVSVKQSNSSGSNRSESHHQQPQSQKTPRAPRPTSIQDSGPYPPTRGGEDPGNHSRLPVPRKRYQSEPQNQPETLAAHRHVAPHPPPPRHTTRMPLRSPHDDGALTAYPRFQRREDHQARLHGTPVTHRRKNKHLGVLPGTGQLAQLTKQVTENGFGHGNQPQTSRHSNVGSLV